MPLNERDRDSIYTDLVQVQELIDRTMVLWEGTTDQVRKAALAMELAAYQQRKKDLNELINANA